MCKIIISAQGEIAEDKVGVETVAEIETALRKFSPDISVNVHFKMARPPGSEV